MLLLAVSVAVSLAYFLRLWLGHDHPVDFRYFWAAGRLWAEGVNPYSDQFAALTLERFGFEAMHRWFYAPHAWAIARPLSELGFEAALALWRVLSMASTLVGVLLLSRAAFPDHHDRRLLAFAILLPLASISQASSINFSIGQFSAFLFLAICAFADAATGPRRWLMVPALVVLTMKASLALPFVAFALAVPRLRLPLVVAGAVSVLLAVPGLFPGGLAVTLDYYRDALAAYSGYAVNAPPDVSGLRNLHHYLTGGDLSPVLLSLVASGLAACLGLACRRTPPHQMRLPVFVLLAGIIFLVQQHSYDWMIFLALVIGWEVASRMAIVLAAAVTFRPNLISDWLGMHDAAVVFYGSRLVSLASLALFAYALAVLPGWLARRKPLPAAITALKP